MDQWNFPHENHSRNSGYHRAHKGCDSHFPKTIPQKETWEGIRTLGVRLSPAAGDFATEFDYHINQFCGLAQNTLSAPLSCFNSYLSLITIVRPMLQYPLGASFHHSPSNNTTKSMPPTLAQYYQKWASTGSRAIIFGTMDYGGFGRHWWCIYSARPASPWIISQP